MSELGTRVETWRGSACNETGRSRLAQRERTAIRGFRLLALTPTPRPTYQTCPDSQEASGGAGAVFMLRNCLRECRWLRAASALSLVFRDPQSHGRLLRHRQSSVTTYQIPLCA